MFARRPKPCVFITQEKHKIGWKESNISDTSLLFFLFHAYPSSSVMLFLHLFLLLTASSVSVRHGLGFKILGFRGGNWGLISCELWRRLVCFWLPTLATAGLHSLMLLMVTNAGNCRTARPYAVSGYQRWQLADYPSLCPAGHQTNLHEHHSSVKLTQACDSREFWRVINNVPDHSDVCSASKMLTANHGIGSVFLIT